MTIDYQGILTQGLARQIAEKLRAAILEGRLQVDERLPTEEELAARFDVSRATVREALKRLAAQHLIRSRRGPAGGTFVTRPTREETRAMVATAAALLVSMDEFSLEDIAEARWEVESLCLRLAALRRTDADLSVLADEIEREQDLTLSDEEFCASDVRFHRALVCAAHNPALEFAAAGLIDSLQPAVNLVVFRFRDRAQVAVQHSRILRALVAQDADAACTALRHYMAELRKQYRKAQQTRTKRCAASQ